MLLIIICVIRITNNSKDVKNQFLIKCKYVLIMINVRYHRYEGSNNQYWRLSPNMKKSQQVCKSAGHG